jgi:hypothetical protein
VQSAFHAAYNTFPFHRAEPKCSGPGFTRNQELGDYLEGITYPYFIGGRPTRYGNYPATVSLMFGVYGVLAITSMAAAELSIRGLGLKPTSAIDSVGQIIALVIAGATIVRAAWLAWKLFWDENKEGTEFCGFMWPGYTWPFKFGNSNLGHNFGRVSEAAPYLLPVAVGQPMTLSEASLPIGSILSDPYTPESNILEVLPAEYHSAPQRQVQVDLQGRSGVESLTADEVETRFFQPTADYVDRVAHAPAVVEYMTSQQKNLWRRPRVYIVNSIKLARDLHWSRSRKRSATARVQVPSEPIPGAPGVLGDVAIEAGFHREVTEHTQLRRGDHGGDHGREERLVLGYRLTEVTTTRKGEVGSGPFRQGALLA